MKPKTGIRRRGPRSSSARKIKRGFVWRRVYIWYPELRQPIPSLIHLIPRVPPMPQYQGLVFSFRKVV